MTHRYALLAAMILATSGVATADTLYVAAPPPQSPGHPMHLGADHRASQVGDLVNVVFNFNVSSASSDVTKSTKDYNVGLGAGIGNAALSFLRFPTGLTGATGADSNRTKNGSNSFSNVMMATVTDVLPSGALAITGVQRLIVNNQPQTMTVSGILRPEDIDNTDSVLSSRIANVDAKFGGDFQEKNKGLIRKVLDVLF